MTTVLILGVAVSMVALLGLFSTRNTDGQLALLALVAGELRLELNKPLRRMRGRVRTAPDSEGIAVRVSALEPRDGDRFLIECVLSPPLHMGLELVPHGRPWSSWYWDPRFRDPDLREAFSVRALHEEQVEPLINGWILRELMRVRSSGHAPRIDDYSLKLTVSCGHDPQHLKLAIERAARLAEGLVLQRAKIPPSAFERDVESAFVPAARRLGGHFDRANLALRVSDGVATLDVWVEHVRGAQWVTRFELELERRLAPQLKLADGRHESLWTRWAGPDVTIGDAAFDAAFIVRGAREDLLRAVLTPEVRSALLELRERLEQLRVENGRISGRVERALTDERVLEGTALALLAVSEAFAQTPRPRSAYR
jgi:hypothetical protein